MDRFKKEVFSNHISPSFKFLCHIQKIFKKKEKSCIILNERERERERICSCECVYFLKLASDALNCIDSLQMYNINEQIYKLQIEIN